MEAPAVVEVAKVTRLPERRQQEVRQVARAVMRERTQKLAPDQRAKDALAVLQTIPAKDAPGMEKGISLTGKELAIHGSFEKDGKAQTVDGIATKIIGKSGEVVTLEIKAKDGSISTQEVPLEIIEVAQLASEGDTLIDTFPDGQRDIIRSLIADYNGQDSKIPGDKIDMQLQASAKELGLTTTDAVKTQLEATKAKLPASQQAKVDAAIVQLDGTLVIDESQAAELLSLTTMSPEDKQKTLADATTRLSEIDEQLKTETNQDTITKLRVERAGLQSDIAAMNSADAQKLETPQGAKDVLAGVSKDLIKQFGRQTMLQAVQMAERGDTSMLENMQKILDEEGSSEMNTRLRALKTSGIVAGGGLLLLLMLISGAIKDS